MVLLVELAAALVGATLVRAQALDTPALLTNGMVAYYPFSGNAQDASGQGNHGTPQFTTLTTNRFGLPNEAYSFDGVRSYIELPTTFAIDGLTNLTLSVWLNARQTGYSGIFDYWLRDWCVTPCLPEGFSLVIDNFSAGIVSCCGPAQASVFRPLTTNTWYHLVCTFDGTDPSPTNRLHYYINGLLAPTGTNNQFPTNTSTPPLWQYRRLIIGGVIDHYGTFIQAHFNGSLDDFRFYNKTLSDQQVQSLFSIESKPLPQLQITKDQKLVFIVNFGRQYQLQTSTDLKVWNNFGGVFTASSTVLTQPVIALSSAGFWRLLVLP